jgi:hypothetical protein
MLEMPGGGAVEVLIDEAWGAVGKGRYPPCWSAPWTSKPKR